MATPGSPTVRQRRLAAELRRLRGNRTGGEVSAGLRWSTSKISRFEAGRSSPPVDEVEKLLDFYGVAEPQRAYLMVLAREANERGWWEDYADVLDPEYMDFIGLEAEATSIAHWYIEVIPGLLQTGEYAHQVMDDYEDVKPTPPAIIERRVAVRQIRWARVLERDPAPELSFVLDESVLRRRHGSSALMHAQMLHLTEAAESPQVDLRVLPLASARRVASGSFVILGFGTAHPDEHVRMRDVVSIESLHGALYVEGETDTYENRRVFQVLQRAALPPVESRQLIRQLAEQLWS